MRLVAMRVKKVVSLCSLLRYRVLIDIVTCELLLVWSLVFVCVIWWLDLTCETGLLSLHRFSIWNGWLDA